MRLLIATLVWGLICALVAGALLSPAFIGRRKS